MELRIDNSERDLRTNEATYHVKHALIELTANLLRVTRGAGKPYEILSQARELLAASKEYGDVVGQAPFFGDIVTVNPRYENLGNIAEVSYSQSNEGYAKDEMLRGALQIVASRLLSQNTQERRGDSELHEGMRRWEEAIAQRNKACDEKRNRERVEAAQRRKTEQQFLLGPRRTPELIDEGSLFIFHEGRAWAEIPRIEQILAAIGFEKHQQGNVISYTCESFDYIIYADPRRKGRIDFRAYEASKTSSRKRPMVASSFYLLETWSDLPAKFRKRVAKLTAAENSG